MFSNLCALKKPYHFSKHMTASLRTAGLFASYALLSTNSFAIETFGLIETEYGYSEDESDISLATAAFGISHELDEKTAAEIVMLYEEGDTDLEVDTAILTFQPSEWATLQAGQSYLGYGVFETYMVSDPLTLELGETRETMVGGEMRAKGFTLSAAAFNGDISSSDKDNQTNQFILGLSHDLEFDQGSILTKLSYINSLADSDSLQELVQTTDSQVDDYTAGWSASFVGKIGQFSLIAEHLSAIDEFAAGVFNTAGDIKPQASTLEIGYLIGETNLGLSYQESEDTQFLELPENRRMIAMFTPLSESLVFGLEYALDKDFDDATTHSMTAQIAAEF